MSDEHTNGLTQAQIEALLQPITEDRVSVVNNMRHVEGWDVRRTLNRVFGFLGWSFVVTDEKMIFETSVERRRKNREGVEYGDPYTAWTVAYKVRGKLTLGRPFGYVEYEDGAIDSGENQPSRQEAHDLAYKSAMTGALKRCAVNLGDQFGLSLYNDGSLAPVVQYLVTLAPEPRTAQQIADDAVHNPAQDTLRALWKEAGAKRAELVDDPRDETFPQIRLGDLLMALRGQ